jgi:hypothetical protein
MAERMLPLSSGSPNSYKINAKTCVSTNEHSKLFSLMMNTAMDPAGNRIITDTKINCVPNQLVLKSISFRIPESRKIKAFRDCLLGGRNS